MMSGEASIRPEAVLAVRRAEAADREQLSQLLLFESHVHKHLYWKPPLDWLGFDPFLLVHQGHHVSAALACPPDPPSIAWLRLFTFSSNLNGPGAWGMLWPPARQLLAQRGGATAAAIAIQRWLDPILLESGFEPVGQIVLLEMNSDAARLTARGSSYAIRQMTSNDLPAVVEVDAASFEPLWRNSLAALTNAFEQATYASVAEDTSGLIAYQLSTGGAFGTHLARLAVRPEAQRRGLGAALVQDLIAHIPSGREPRLTVNTQSNNAASLALYARLGFRRTGERFPVFACEVEAAPNSVGGSA